MSEVVIYHTIPEQIAAQLRRSILAGEFEPGRPLREQDLAAKFGVSRGPIREAFRLLTVQGLLEAEPNKGVRIAREPSGSIRPLLVRLRQEIETFALAGIFEQISAADIARWETILAAIKEACERGDLALLVESDLQFHRAIVQCHADKDLFAIWQPIAMRMLMHYHRLGDLMESYHEHQRILEAIRSGDQEAAIKALEDNIQ